MSISYLMTLDLIWCHAYATWRTHVWRDSFYINNVDFVFDHIWSYLMPCVCDMTHSYVTWLFVYRYCRFLFDIWSRHHLHMYIFVFDVMRVWFDMFICDMTLSHTLSLTHTLARAHTHTLTHTHTHTHTHAHTLTHNAGFLEPDLGPHCFQQNQAGFFFLGLFLGLFLRFLAGLCLRL